ncbi:MAG: DUF3267 domain-containing protein [Saccharofermentanales bacterium]
MFIIPGVIISIATFPGVIVHELAHQLFCRLFRVPVYEVCYFRFQNPCGYVMHEPVKDPFKNLMISVGPFILNSLLGILIVFPAAIEVLEFGNYGNPLYLLLAWLGISILMHSFPSTGDAENLYQSVIKNKSVRIWTKILVLPVVGVIYAGAFGSIFWLDFVYAIVVAMMVPNLIVNLL